MSESVSRYGLTIPLGGLGLIEHADLVRSLPDLGYTDAWTAETNSVDAFTPLVLASQWAPSLRLGTAIVPAYTRGPALIAMSAASLAAAAPGRFCLGLGSSSPAIVQDWNGIPFEQPFRRTRDVLRFVKSALAGERVDGDFDTFSIKRFRLEGAPAEPLPVFLAALRPQMLALAGREADGVILNWLAATDVPQCVAAVDNPSAEVVARIFVCPSEDVEYVRTVVRMMITAYLTVPAYAAFQVWLGRGPALEQMSRLWAAGDRKGALAAVPDAVIDELVVHGSAQECREHVQRYVAAGVTTPVLALVPTPQTASPEGFTRMVAALAPRA